MHLTVSGAFSRYNQVETLVRAHRQATVGQKAWGLREMSDGYSWEGIETWTRAGSSQSKLRYG
jgi:hypothetical protein